MTQPHFARALRRLLHFLLALACNIAAAQMPPDIAARVRDLGVVIAPPPTAAIYAPLQQKEPYSGAKVLRDQKYGPAERNLLDVFAPSQDGSMAKPVLLFVHGGGFTAGNKRTGDSPFYDNIMLWAVRQGFVGVNMTYRLAPANPWPAAVQDVSQAVQWTLANIRAHGGDPARIYLMGHSAGAVHVGSYVSHPEFHGPQGAGLAGALMISGLYQFTADTVSPAEIAYFGADASQYAQRSSLDGLMASRIPLLVAVAELDPLPFQKQITLLTDALCKRQCPVTVKLAGHSHMSEVYAINTPDEMLTRPMADFIRAAR